MFQHTRTTSLVGIALCAFALVAQTCNAGTIIKLSLGGDPSVDIEFTGGVGGVLSTADDAAVPATTGDQNTAVEFLDFLEAIESDILTPTASFSLDGLVASGTATVIGGAIVVQNFAGGTLELYDPANVLLLSGTLGLSALSGKLGPPGAGGLFSTSFAVVTGGTLAPYIDPNSLSLSVALVDINGGAGLSVSPLPPPLPPPPPPGFAFGVLDAFTADASVEIAGEFVPEPSSMALALLAGVSGVASARRKRR
jgi:hypothetical protein